MLKNLLKSSMVIVPLFVCVFFFQNCAKDTDISAYQESSSNGSTSIPVTTDTTAPVVAILTQPIEATVAKSAVFTFSASDNVGVDRIQCALDSAALAICPTSVTYSGLAVGQHTLKVQAVDAAGNISASVAYSWTILSPVPVYRSYQARLRDHFYSQSQSEGPSKGWVDEGIAFYVLPSKIAGTQELYRCIVKGTIRHFLSSNATCENQTSDGILGYVYSSQTETSQKQLYRYFNGVDHITTAGPVNLSGFSFENNQGWAY